MHDTGMHHEPLRSVLYIIRSQHSTDRPSHRGGGNSDESRTMIKNVLALLLMFSGGDGGLSNAFSVGRSSLVGARSSFTKRQTGASTTSGYYSTITSNHHPLAALPLEVIDPSYNLALGSLALGSIFVVPGSPLKQLSDSHLMIQTFP